MKNENIEQQTFGISGKDERLLRQICHRVGVHVRDVDGVVEAGVVEVDVDGVLWIVVDTFHDPDWVPDHETALKMHGRGALEKKEMKTI